MGKTCEKHEEFYETVCRWCEPAPVDVTNLAPTPPPGVKRETEVEALLKRAPDQPGDAPHIDPRAQFIACRCGDYVFNRACYINRAFEQPGRNGEMHTPSRCSPQEKPLTATEVMARTDAALAPDCAHFGLSFPRLYRQRPLTKSEHGVQLAMLSPRDCPKCQHERVGSLKLALIGLAESVNRLGVKADTLLGHRLNDAWTAIRVDENKWGRP